MYKTQTEQINELTNRNELIKTARLQLISDLRVTIQHYPGFSDITKIQLGRILHEFESMTNTAFVMDTQYNENCQEPDDYDPCADCSDHACEYGSCSMSRG